MNRLAEVVCELPSFVSMITEVATKLGDHQSVLCLTGHSATPQSIVQRAQAHPSMKSRYPFEVDCVQGPPLIVLSETLGWDVERVLAGDSSTDVQSGVVYVSNFDDAAPDHRASWLLVMERWAARQQMAQTTGEQVLPSVLVATRGGSIEKLPSGQLHLSVVGCTAVLSSLELSLAIRLARDDADWMRATWRESVLPAVAGADVELANACWDECVGTPDDVAVACRNVALARKWRPGDVDRMIAALDAPRGASVQQVTQLSIPMRLAWAAGVVTYTPETGFERSAAASALLDKRADIERRVWRGQARLVLPLVDRIRFELCLKLDERLPPGWQLRPPPKDENDLEEVRADPLACEPAHIQHILREVSTLPKRQLESFRCVARRCKDVRNTLAHYRPIAFNDFKELLQAAQDGQLPVGIQSGA
jgi:hypothetical protein